MEEYVSAKKNILDTSRRRIGWYLILTMTLPGNLPVSKGDVVYFSRKTVLEKVLC